MPGNLIRNAELPKALSIRGRTFGKATKLLLRSPT
jgi:hypothetical protein